MADVPPTSATDAANPLVFHPTMFSFKRHSRANTLQISPQDPYAHYRRPGSACFEKLFDQEEIDRFNRETVNAQPVGGVWGGVGAENIGEAEWRDIRGFWEW